VAQTSITQAAFNAGIFSPALFGRSDIRSYSAAISDALNFIPKVAGSIAKRPGTRFVASAKTADYPVRLMSFIFNAAQTYVLEFGHLYMRVFKAEEQVLDGGDPYEIVTPYTSDEVFGIQKAQSADQMFLTHPNHPPQTLSRTADDAWTIADTEILYGPMGDVNTDDNVFLRVIQPAASHGKGATDVQFESRTVSPAATTDIFDASRDVGRKIMWRNPPSGSETEPLWSYYTITSVTDGHTVVCTCDYGGGTQNEDEDLWALGDFYINNYPRTVTFFEQRLCYGGVPDTPNTFYASAIGDFPNFAPYELNDADPPGATPTDWPDIITDATALRYVISSDEVNSINWMRPARTLLLGSGDGVWEMGSSALQTEPVTPTNITIRTTNASRAGDRAPIGIENRIYYLSRFQRKLHRIAYAIEADSYVSFDSSAMAPHLVQNGIQQLEFAAEPEPIAWAVRNDGILLGCTIDESQRVTAWHRHIFGGTWFGGHARCESAAVVPDQDEEYSQLWVAVRRQADAGPHAQQHIEFLTQPLLESDEDHMRESHYLDSAPAPYDGGSTTVITGLDHLEGLTVAVVADWGRVDDALVSDGQITLETAAQYVEAGLLYDGQVDGLPLQPQDAQGGSTGKKTRGHGVALRLNRSLGGSIGYMPRGSYTSIPYRDIEDPMDSAPPPFSGVQVLKVSSGMTRDARLSLIHNDPFPFELLSWTPWVDVASR
jgi:hypothetical protein